MCTHEVSRTDKIVGMVVALCGAIAFSLTAASIQMTGGRISAMENLFVRALTLSIFCLVSMLWRGIPIFGPPGTRKAIALRAVAGSIHVLLLPSGSDASSQGCPTVFQSIRFLRTRWGLPFSENKLNSFMAFRSCVLVGAVVIVRPGFLFGEEEGRDVGREMTGYMFCLFGSVFCAISYSPRLVSVRAPRDAKTATPLVFAASYGAMIGALGASFVFPDAAIGSPGAGGRPHYGGGYWEGSRCNFRSLCRQAHRSRRYYNDRIQRPSVGVCVANHVFQGEFQLVVVHWLVLVVGSICMVSIQKLYSPSASKANKVADLEMMTAGDKAVGEDAEEAVAQDAEEALAQDAAEAKGIENDAGWGC